ncbi:hypothetical protein H257_05584, partial [Aphanomyces astaci]
MVATFKGAQRRRRSSIQPPSETELQMPLEDLMFSPYKRRKVQKQKDMQAANLAKLQQAAKYFDMIDNVKLETSSAAVDDDVDGEASATSTPYTTPTKQSHVHSTAVHS